MHDYLVVNCRHDDYFLCIYLNCMIYCLIRNRALHLALRPQHQQRNEIPNPKVVQHQIKKKYVSSRFSGVKSLIRFEPFNH